MSSDVMPTSSATPGHGSSKHEQAFGVQCNINTYLSDVHADTTGRCPQQAIVQYLDSQDHSIKRLLADRVSLCSNTLSVREVSLAHSETETVYKPQKGKKGDERNGCQKEELVCF